MSRITYTSTVTHWTSKGVRYDVQRLEAWVVQQWGSQLAAGALMPLKSWNRMRHFVAVLARHNGVSQGSRRRPLNWNLRNSA